MLIAKITLTFKNVYIKIFKQNWGHAWVHKINKKQTNKKNNWIIFLGPHVVVIDKPDLKNNICLKIYNFSYIFCYY